MLIMELLTFSDIFTLEGCYVTILRNTGTVIRKSDDGFLVTPRNPVVVCKFIFRNTFSEVITDNTYFDIFARRLENNLQFKISDKDNTFNIYKKLQYGVSQIRFYNIKSTTKSGSNRFDINVLFAKG